MFDKVLVAEDFGSTNLGIVQTLIEKLKIVELEKEQYCDKAYNRLTIAHKNKVPFQLLITDISFVENPLIKRNLSSGIALIDAIGPIQPSLKIIVYSMEDNPAIIKRLFENQQIDGYVCKGLNGLEELVVAVKEVYMGNNYVSPKVNQVLSTNTFELDDYDILILQYLEKGLSKKEIVRKLKKDNISPNSESTLEKRVGRLLDHFGTKNTTSLVAALIRAGQL